MRRHTPHLSLANLLVLISATSVRLLRLSCVTHPLLCLVKTNPHQKSHRQKPSHVPSRAGEASGELLFSDPRASTRPAIRLARDPHSQLTLALPIADVSPSKKKKKRE